MTNDTARQHLTELRKALLRLHKALIDSEQIEYARLFGPIASPAALIHLIEHDPWFAWLHPISNIIVTIDEALDAGEGITDYDVSEFTKTASATLAPSESGEGFARHYYEALQRDPDVILAHANVTRLQR
jgi:hypothetical protein